MDQLLKTESIPALLVVIVLVLCVNFIKGLAEFLWKIKEKHDSVSESAVKELTETVRRNTIATEHLDRRLGEVEDTFSELPKLKLDMRKFYAAVKILSGDRWSQIRKEMEEEEI